LVSVIQLSVFDHVPDPEPECDPAPESHQPPILSRRNRFGIPVRVVKRGKGADREEHVFVDHTRCEESGYTVRVEGEVGRDTEPLKSWDVVEITHTRNTADNDLLGRFYVSGGYHQWGAGWFTIGIDRISA
jgi:hypothetical protein